MKRISSKSALTVLKLKLSHPVPPPDNETGRLLGLDLGLDLGLKVLGLRVTPVQDLYSGTGKTNQVKCLIVKTKVA